MKKNIFQRLDKVTKKTVLSTFSFLLVLSAHLAAEPLVIVANAKSPVTSLTYEQATALFLGKVFSLSGAGNIVLVDQPESNAMRNEFYLTLTGKKVIQVKGIWMRLVFSGKGVPPIEVANSVEVKKFLAKNIDALGYIEKSAVDDSVKVLLIVQ